MCRVLIFTLFVFLIACESTNSQPASTTINQPIAKTQPTSTKIHLQKAKVEADFPYDIDLKTIEGKIINTKNILKQNGKPTVLLFWLTTCYPCRKELKAIKAVYEDWQKEEDFNFIAVSTDFEKNYGAFVQRVKESGWQFESFYDYQRGFRHVLPGGLNGLPQTFIFDKSGEIIYHKRKYLPGDENKLFAKIKELNQM